MAVRRVLGDGWTTCKVMAQLPARSACDVAPYPFAVAPVRIFEPLVATFGFVELRIIDQEKLITSQTPASPDDSDVHEASVLKQDLDPHGTMSAHLTLDILKGQ